ncbi:solute carrier family 22 member 1 isoform X2 [Lepeophtheirus salmonis]|uniref:solute carrier family 22 member 1 isoform X2 n=1 Tax=Lepeophtheirus salmonis TaxID=72036 RepID=UPI001AE93865|nr:solute carrier family 22 member 1-like isoform X2 [Lepeophtheirus salmonis]
MNQMELDPEYLLDLAGSWNKYQGRQAFIFVLAVLYYTYSHYAPILYIYVGDNYHCHIQASEHWNLSQNELRNIFIPQLNGQFDKCNMYDVNVDKVLEDGSIPSNGSWPVTKCLYGWNYDTSFQSISTEFNWVCKDEWKGTFTQTVYFLGSAIGTIIFGWIGDHMGRYWTVLLSHWSLLLMGILQSFVWDFYSYSIVRFFMGFTVKSVLLSFALLSLEFVNKSKRSVTINFALGLGITVGGTVISSLIYFLKDWRMVNHILYAQVLLSLALPYSIHESVHWLLEKKKYKKASQVLQKISSINGKVIPESTIKLLENHEDTKSPNALAPGLLDLFKTPRLRRHFILVIVLWSSIIVLFEANVLNIRNLKFNIFYTFAISVGVELPADIIVIFTMEQFGRRWTSFFSMFLSGIAMLITAYLTAKSYSNTIIMIVCMVGRFAITMAINAGTQYNFEICPTNLRSQGSSMIIVIGELFALIAPSIVFSSSLYTPLPFLLLGIGGIVFCWVALFLPETARIEMPANCEEGEKFGLDQKFFHVPMFKNRN